MVAFTPDGKHLASGSSWELRPLRLWDIQTGKLIREIKGPARVVAFSPDGKRLAGSSEDNTVKVWDAQNDQGSISLPADGGKSIALSPDWRLVASVAADNTLQIKDAHSGQVILTLKGHTIPVRTAAFSPDGTRLASGGGGQGTSANFGVGREDQSDVKVWDVQSGQELFAFPMSNGSVFAVVFSSDGKRLAAASLAPGQNIPPVVKIWNVQTGEELLALREASFSLAFSPDGKSLACGAKVLDAQSSKQLFSLPSAFNVAFSPDGTRLITGGRTVKIWDALTGEEVAQLKGGRTKWQSNKIVMSPDGKRIAALDAGGKLTVLDSQTGLELITLSGSGDYFPILAFRPDGHRLATSGPNGTLKLYDATPLPEKP